MAPNKIQDDLTGQGNYVSRWYKRRVASGKCTKAGCCEAPMQNRRRCLAHAQEASKRQLERYYAKKAETASLAASSEGKLPTEQ